MDVNVHFGFPSNKWYQDAVEDWKSSKFVKKEDLDKDRGRLVISTSGANGIRKVKEEKVLKKELEEYFRILEIVVHAVYEEAGVEEPNVRIPLRSPIIQVTPVALSAEVLSQQPQQRRLKPPHPSKP